MKQQFEAKCPFFSCDLYSLSLSWKHPCSWVLFPERGTCHQHDYTISLYALPNASLSVRDTASSLRAELSDHHRLSLTSTSHRADLSFARYRMSMFVSYIPPALHIISIQTRSSHLLLNHDTSDPLTKPALFHTLTKRNPEC